MKGHPSYLLWPPERLKLELKEVEQDFMEPEQNRLLREIARIETDHQRRHWIGKRLAMIGDPRSGIGLDECGLPQIDWLLVTPGSEISIEYSGGRLGGKMTRRQRPSGYSPPISRST